MQVMVDDPQLHVSGVGHLHVEQNLCQIQQHGYIFIYVYLYISELSRLDNQFNFVNV